MPTHVQKITIYPQPSISKQYSSKTLTAKKGAVPPPSSFWKYSTSNACWQRAHSAAGDPAGTTWSMLTEG